MDLDFFKAEHAALLDLSQQLLTTIDAAGGSREVTLLRGHLGRVLTAHLVKEDAYLYPRLRSKPGTAALAERNVEELGNLAGRWHALTQDWPDDRIDTDRTGFGDALRAVLTALAERIRAEEEELYPLIAETSWPSAA